MDIGSQCISKDCVSVLPSGGRSLCVPATPPSGEVCFQISRSRSNSGRCLSPRLEEVEEFHSAPCEPSSSGNKEDPGRGSISSGGGTELAQHALVPTISTDVGGLPPASSSVQVPFIPTIRPSGSPPSVGNPQPDCMASIRRRFETAGFSPDVIKVLLSSWSESTKKRYAGPWRAWAEWCAMRGWCPFSAPVTSVLLFLASLLKEKDLEYRTIAVYRYAISQTHDLVDSVPLGELPIVSKFMKGVFRTKPPKPKYCSSLNVAKVLDFLRNQEPLDKLSLKLLTFKLTVLLAITTSARAHQLAALDLDFSLVMEDAWEFTIPEHVKNSRPGHPPRKFYLPSFPQDNAICVVRVLRAYTLRTGNIRKARKLLISYIPPYDSVSSQTVSRWLAQAIHLAGIPLEFTGHSNRSASTSAAAAAGLSLDLIVEAGDWSSARVFEKHYHKRPDRTAFVHAVLNS